ncbi:MAG: inorganic phosphate transporter [Planctomycetes bacterium]|nr:inorganic phosphate transporter [Planctomycetota bacterium]
MDPVTIVICVVIFALLFDMANGWNDASNAIATVVGTRVMRPVPAVIFGAIMNGVGALFSAEVAKTVGAEIVPKAILNDMGVGPFIFMAAVAGAPIWITWCTLKGLPISCSHSLLGALVGAALFASGTSGVMGDGIMKVVKGIFISPVAGFLFGLILVVIIARLCSKMKPRKANWFFDKAQVISAGAMAFSHGTGDAQKAMGIITGVMIATHQQDVSGGFYIEPWVRFSCAAAMFFGSLVGGWGVMRTLGSRLGEMKSYQGFAAETGASTTILLNTLAGVPISTTHSITGAIMGVAAAKGRRAVRWNVGKKILFAWVATFPASMATGAVCYILLRGLLMGAWF